MNRISYPDWAKLCVDPNSQIKLRAKQKYEILSATIAWPQNFRCSVPDIRYITLIVTGKKKKKRNEKHFESHSTKV